MKSSDCTGPVRISSVIVIIGPTRSREYVCICCPTAPVDGSSAVIVAVHPLVILVRVQDTGEVNGPIPLPDPLQSTTPKSEAMFSKSFPVGEVTVKVVSLIAVFEITVGAVISISGGNLRVIISTFPA